MTRLRVLLSCLGLALALPAHAMFRCVDEKGVTHFGDTMPVQCEKKSITELNKQGTVVRKFEPPPTAEQMRQRELERQLRAAESAKIEEQKLKDRAVLSTYASVKEFDAIRDRDLAQLEGRKRSAVQRAESLDRSIEKRAEEMEFYRAGTSKAGKNREVPPLLQADYNRAVHDRQALSEEIARIDEDKKEIVDRYDSAKTRFKKLKSGMPIGTLEDNVPGLPTQVVGQSPLLPGRSRGLTRCQGKIYDCSMGISYECRTPKADGPGFNPSTVYCQEDKRQEANR
ncbi:MAG: DUF4124 domain-containing protein [Betaproteobacteria bacterium]|nr:DUF4124 domain-containing protein [Betaproteobacteria bacterium]